MCFEIQALFHHLLESLKMTGNVFIGETFIPQNLQIMGLPDWVCKSARRKGLTVPDKEIARDTKLYRKRLHKGMFLSHAISHHSCGLYKARHHSCGFTKPEMLSFYLLSLPISAH